MEGGPIKEWSWKRKVVWRFSELAVAGHRRCGEETGSIRSQDSGFRSHIDGVEEMKKFPEERKKKTSGETRPFCLLLLQSSKAGDGRRRNSMGLRRQPQSSFSDDGKSSNPARTESRGLFFLSGDGKAPTPCPLVFLRFDNEGMKASPSSAIAEA
ncbi:hypothetical protein MRB53_036191 [Persea americana]|uniref:Uncharacterized protein n=1 Tax=Persea americana TaxID=3435 RepID=A0ACC2K6T2_PERAE|nr:hypothetical protein MRB53_036191 [Persea americana]